MATQTPSREKLANSLDIVVSGVHKRAFLHKLAQLGHVPETHQEADALVSLGFKLASLDPSVREPDPFVTQRHSPAGKYAEAAAALDDALGIEKQADDSIYDAAVALAQDPAIYGAALTIKQAEAAQQQAQRQQA